MAGKKTSTNPLTITLDENTKVRAIFRQLNVQVNPITIETQPTVQVTWRDCLDGTLRDGTPPLDYIQVAYNGAGGGTCWEPSATIGFEPDLDKVLTFDWRRGTATLPDARRFTVVNPSSAVSFEATITTNSNLIVTPSTFTLNPRSTQVVIITPTQALFDALGDGISTLNFKIEFVEKI